jgi:hypothetical protein
MTTASLIKLIYLKSLTPIWICFQIILTTGCVDPNYKSTKQELKWDCEFVREVNDTLSIIHCKEYYETGELFREGDYIGEVMVRWHKFYRKDGSLEKEIEYVWLENDSSGTVNQLIRYDEKGDTLKSRSNYFSINAERDTIVFGDTFKAEIILAAPHWDTSFAEFYFDIPHDTSSLRVLCNGELSVQYDYTPNDTGTMFMSGYLKEFNSDTIDFKNRLTNQGIKYRIMHFDYKYIVKEKKAGNKSS